MDDELLNSRLSQIATRWTLLRGAHGDDRDELLHAQSRLLERYQRPIYRYLIASLGSADAADEVFQEFAMRLLRGGFRNVSPERGRFRSYLKTAIGRMVLDYRRKQARRGPQQLESFTAAEPAGAGQSAERLFDQSWRTEVLDRAWKALAAYQESKGNAYYSVLRFRAEHPTASSEQMAASLNEQLRPARPLTDASVRQTLKRAREKFAEMLLAEVATSLETDDFDRIEAELAELELLPYCRPALERRRS